MRFLFGFILVALGGYAAIVAFFYLAQAALLYPAGREKIGAGAAGLPDFEDVTLTTEDGETIVGWYKPAAPGRATLLYFHGNGGSLLNRRDRAVMLTEGGRGLLIVSYRGYSGSTGTPSEAGLRIDARTAYAWLAARAPAERLVLYGESLGSGVAVRLATEKPVAGLILDAPFTSAADVAGHHYWYLPVWLLRDQYRSIDRIHELKSPAPRYPWRPRWGHPDRARRAPLRRRARAEALRDAAGRRPCQRARTGRARSGAVVPRRRRADGPVSRTVRVRTALAADREAIVGLIRALNIHEAAITGDRLVTHSAADAYYLALLDRIARQEGRLLAAAAEAGVVGMLGLIVQEDQVFVRADLRRHGYVSDLVVEEAWRGQGVGRLLIGEAERLTREKGLKRLVIGVMAGNAGAERLYGELGFSLYAKAMMKPL